MTPEEKALRDAFLAECWRPVSEWHQSSAEESDALARNLLLDETRGAPELPFSEAS